MCTLITGLGVLAQPLPADSADVAGIPRSELAKETEVKILEKTIK